jgi:hypothetical protein
MTKKALSLCIIAYIANTFGHEKKKRYYKQICTTHYYQFMKKHQ